ncbi:MAG: hypothetical protein QM756_37615 [Polyangiaceae bacterium]
MARATSLELGAGASVSSSEFDTRTLYTFAPTGVAILHHVASASPGRLLLNLSATCLPVIDPTTGTFDQRLMLGASATQIRHYTQYFVSVNGATSVKSSSSASFTGFAANAGAARTVAKGIAIEGGVRAAFQTVGDTTRIPLSGVVYIGVDFLARD